MYLRAVHADATIQPTQQLIHQNPLGILTTAIPSQTHPFLQSSHIPFILDVNPDGKVKLRGHIAKANPQAKAMVEYLSTQDSNTLNQEVLILFNSPVQHYVTPKFYVQTKPDSGKVVPTWNYAAAQVYGKARVFHKNEPETIEFLMKQVSDLSKFAEEDVMRFQRAWKVSDAPERYIEILRKNIIGIEIEVDRMEGKFKMSQEMSEGDRQGVVAGFQGLNTELGREMADLVKERGEIKDAAKG